jgi:hypothetical protein
MTNNESTMNQGNAVIKLLWRRASPLRSFIVSVGGVVFMFCCLAILTVGSCKLD